MSKTEIVERAIGHWEHYKNEFEYEEFGEWRSTTFEGQQCSECGDQEKLKSKFCPRCGARMEDVE